MLSRRAVLQRGLFAFGGMAIGDWKALLPTEVPVLTLGLVTDVHWANKPASGTRHYQASLRKLEDAFRLFRANGVDHIVHMGDLVDSYPKKEDEQAAIGEVSGLFHATHRPFSFILGNHCLEAVDKKEYATLARTEIGPLCLDRNGVRILCLDACFKADGTAYAHKNFDYRDTFVPPSQVEWLKTRILEHDGPCLILTHQLLDPMKDMSVANASELNALVESSPNVIGVLQGHAHQNRLAEIGGKPYVVIRSVVDGPTLADCGVSVVRLYSDGSFRIQGLKLQQSYEFPRKASETIQPSSTPR